MVEGRAEGGKEKGNMSLVFQEYEQQYCELSADLYRRCSAAGQLFGELKKQSIVEIKSELEEAETLITKMDLEVRTLEPDARIRLLVKIREHRADFKNLKNEVKKAASASGEQTAREKLLEMGVTNTLEVSADQSGKLLMASSERQNKSTDRIRESKKLMLETEELGASILQDLHQQRQSLLHAHSMLQGVDDNISRSKKILTAMAIRMDRNKCIVGFIIAAFVLAIIISMYYKLSR